MATASPAAETTMARPSAGASVFQDGVNGFALEPLAAIEGDELNEKRERMHLPPEATDEIDRRASGAAGRQQIVHDEHTLAMTDSVGVHFKRVGAVLERVGLPECCRWQFAGLSH